MATVNDDIQSEQTYFWHLKRLLMFGMPLVAAQMLQHGIAFTDSTMVGKLGELELSQIGLGSQFIFMMIIIPVGVGIAVSVLTGTAFAKKNDAEMRAVMATGIHIHLLIYVLLIPLMWNAGGILSAMKQPAASIAGASTYIRVLMLAMPMIYIANVLRSYLVGLERGNQALYIALFGFVVNIIGNYILIYGKFGAPALGLIGSAIASLITNFMVMVITLWLVLRDPVSREVGIFADVLKWRGPMFGKMMKLGIPMSFGIWSEVGMFIIAGIFIGWFGVSALAANTIVGNMSGLTFMIPLGLATAAAVRAGNALGRNDRDGLIRGALVAYAVVLAVMIITALSFWLIPEFFVARFLPKEAENYQLVMAYAVSMFLGSALFQIFDGAQVVSISVLRGIQDATIPAGLAFFSYWIIGVTMSYVLGVHFDMGGLGVWLGLAIGLAVASVLLGARLYQQLRADKLARRLENQNASS